MECHAALPPRTSLRSSSAGTAGLSGETLRELMRCTRLGIETHRRAADRDRDRVVLGDHRRILQGAGPGRPSTTRSGSTGCRGCSRSTSSRRSGSACEALSHRLRDHHASMLTTIFAGALVTLTQAKSGDLQLWEGQAPTSSSATSAATRIAVTMPFTVRLDAYGWTTTRARCGRRTSAAASR